MADVSISASSFLGHYIFTSSWLQLAAVFHKRDFHFNIQT